ncbi:hypothetical protein Ancab_012453 [Ancistrocladus abbreviatus]
MGDKEEDEHITIPILGQESYYQSPSPPENPNTEIVVDKSSQRTPSGGSPSTDEPRPPSGDALPPEANKSKDEKWTAEGCFWLCVIIVLFLPCFLLYALTAMLWFDTNVLDDVEDDAKKQTYRRALEFKGRAFRVIKLVAAILSLVMIGLLTWLVINLSVKSLKRKIILGAHLWQWTLAVVILSFGYPTINMVTSLILLFFKKMHEHRKDVVYFTEELKTSFNLVIFSSGGTGLEAQARALMGPRAVDLGGSSCGKLTEAHYVEVRPTSPFSCPGVEAHVQAPYFNHSDDENGPTGGIV